MYVRRSSERGHANHGWLNTRHSFSFARYYDRQHMGFGHLRVINQDVVSAGRGFGTHPHRNMEIISYVLRGALAHRDTLGTGSIIRPGDVQLMSAGAGIAHSEFNASQTEPVSFLQIWIMPRTGGGQPRYEQRTFPKAETNLKHIVSSDGRNGTLTIKQDMNLHRIDFNDAATQTHTLQYNRAWVQVIDGTLSVNGMELHPGDGLGLSTDKTVHLHSDSRVEALLFDLT